MAIDLRKTYLHLVDETNATPVPVDAEFWPKIGERTHLQAHRLLMRFDFTEDWNVWEIHPNGDEVVIQLTGEMTLILDLPDGPSRHVLKAGEAIVVPKNVWHTADVSAPASALFITHGRGTENKAR